MGPLKVGDGSAYGGMGNGGARARIGRDKKGSSQEGVVDFDQDGELE